MQCFVARPWQGNELIAYALLWTLLAWIVVVLAAVLVLSHTSEKHTTDWCNRTRYDILHDGWNAMIRLRNPKHCATTSGI